MFSIWDTILLLLTLIFPAVLLLMLLVVVNRELCWYMTSPMNDRLKTLKTGSEILKRYNTVLHVYI